MINSTRAAFHKADYGTTSEVRELVAELARQIPFFDSRGEDWFLTEMIARPDDQEVRLVYADWLEEQGSHRCHFTLEHALRDPADRPHHWRRSFDWKRLEGEVADEIGAYPANSRKAQLYGPEGKNGFVRMTAESAAVFVQHAGEAISNCRPDLSDNHLNSPGVRQLINADPEQFPQLKHVNVSANRLSRELELRFKQRFPQGSTTGLRYYRATFAQID